MQRGELMGKDMIVDSWGLVQVVPGKVFNCMWGNF
jgi:hypothetical protein